MTIPSNLMVSISGIRGTVPEPLTAEVAYAFAWAYAAILPEGPVVVSRDSRPSGPELKGAVIRALQTQGREVLDADLIPLPTTQLAVEKTHAAGAIDVTASHNPAEYNGLKFLNNNGIFIDQATLDKLLEQVRAFSDHDGHKDGVTTDIHEQAMGWHVELLKDKVLPGKRLMVAVDAVNGAGSIIIPRLLSQMDCDLLPIAVDPTQPFPHVPEPLPANLVWTQEQLKGKQFDLCLVVDPDADRLVVIDENGRLIPEEATIPLVAQELMLQGRKGPIVINMSTSRMTEDVAAQYGSTVERSKVGEVNVVTRMQEVNAIYGGEGGGGVIDPEIHYGRDSLVGLTYVVSLIRRTGKPLSQLVDELPHYEMLKTKLPVPTGISLNEIYDKVQAKYPDAKANRLDGLRLDWADRWVHLRPSNTEPIFRIIAEAPTREEVEKLASAGILL
ncbi:MAG: phosphoglucosamine mutase [bacterium]